MKKTIAFVVISTAICIYVAFTSAASLAIGGIHLSGDIVITEDSVEITKNALNDALLELSGSPWKCEICGKSAEDALITAKTITADFAKTPDKRQVVTKAVATTKVVIHAKQVDKVKKSTRYIHASADKADFTPAEGNEDANIVLTGNAVVKMTDPDLAEPTTLTGDSITIYLNKKKVSVKAGDMRIKPKEEAQQ